MPKYVKTPDGNTVHIVEEHDDEKLFDPPNGQCVTVHGEDTIYVICKIGEEEVDPDTLKRINGTQGHINNNSDQNTQVKSENLPANQRDLLDSGK